MTKAREEHSRGTLLRVVRKNGRRQGEKDPKALPLPLVPEQRWGMLTAVWRKGFRPRYAAEAAAPRGFLPSVSAPAGSRDGDPHFVLLWYPSSLGCAGICAGKMATRAVDVIQYDNNLLWVARNNHENKQMQHEEYHSRQDQALHVIGWRGSRRATFLACHDPFLRKFKKEEIKVPVPGAHHLLPVNPLSGIQVSTIHHVRCVYHRPQMCARLFLSSRSFVFYINL